jgi:8-oxo-dGTP diphosphatase
MNSVICTVDVVLLTLKNNALHVALLKRDREPFAGTLALPGGFIHADEDRDDLDAASRILREKAGISSPYLEQLGTFAGAARDPRGWSASIAHYALVPEEVIVKALSPAVQLVPVDGLKGLPFDHQLIVETAVARVRSKSTYSSLPAHLAGEQFTIPQLQKIYELLMGEPINKVSFYRKMTELAMIEEVPDAFETTRGKPAQLYRLKKEFRSVLSMTDRALNAGK